MVDKYAEHPDQINLSPYAYVGNNPIDKTDPDGNCPDPPCAVPAQIQLAPVLAEGAEALVVAGATALGIYGLHAIMTSASNGIGRPVMQRDAIPQPLHTEQAKRGANNEKTKEAAQTGQEAHRQEQKKLREQGAETEVPMTLPKTGDKVRKDAVMPDGTAIIIKPNTPSGNASADKRQKLMDDNGIPNNKILYDPQNPAYKPGSPTYIGPKK